MANGSGPRLPRTTCDPDVIRYNIPSTAVGYRKVRRAYWAGERVGGEAMRLAKSTRSGDCDDIKSKAQEFARSLLAADPELWELKQTDVPRRPPRWPGQGAKRSWQDAISDLAEAGARRVIDVEWFRMGCRPGKQLLVLPKDFEGVRRYRRRLLRWG